MVNFYIGFIAGFIVSLACTVVYNYKRRTTEDRGNEQTVSGTDSTVERNSTTGQQIIKEAAEAGKTVQDIINVVRSRTLDDTDSGLCRE